MDTKEMQVLVTPLIYNLFPLNGLQDWETLLRFAAAHPLWKGNKHGGKCLKDKEGCYPCLTCLQGLVQAIGERLVERLIKQVKKDKEKGRKFVRQKEYFFSLDLLKQKATVERLLEKNKLYKQYKVVVEESWQKD